MLDNLSNSSEEVLSRVQETTGKDVMFYKGDVFDCALLEGVFDKQKIDTVILFISLKLLVSLLKSHLNIIKAMSQAV